ncbi:hypothetical protein TNIN_321781 [Trichonephila inaurata madagascariensis]|uniref:Uncharacterized protein n=1 Tax=Trichonephila inaurata madagascariensis TaxID=2747483 RepID=A0A8X7C2E5_9ARAC|nr:hypothetical protein TNIN_203831 [Trichonephila inaurata madagascariensis]GFY55233.1 hypothetical protein TNIN_321781 [Trichonephila inaurata madagascariensis]
MRVKFQKISSFPNAKHPLVSNKVSFDLKKSLELNSGSFLSFVTSQFTSNVCLKEVLPFGQMRTHRRGTRDERNTATWDREVSGTFFAPASLT